ncbi:MAG: hypothetical protein ACK5PS_16085, partial [Desulfopila sp.]
HQDGLRKNPDLRGVVTQPANWKYNWYSELPIATNTEIDLGFYELINTTAVTERVVLKEWCCCREEEGGEGEFSLHIICFFTGNTDIMGGVCEEGRWVR